MLHVCHLKKKREKAIQEGWEYARLANLSYHITEHKLDFARRRRWIRKLVSDKPGERAVFKWVQANQGLDEIDKL